MHAATVRKYCWSVRGLEYATLGCYACHMAVAMGDHTPFSLERSSLEQLQPNLWHSEKPVTSHQKVCGRFRRQNDSGLQTKLIFQCMPHRIACLDVPHNTSRRACLFKETGMRRAKLAEEHFLQGTVSQSKATVNSHIPAGRPKFPRGFPKSLRPLYKRMCGLLQERRALTAADEHALRLYCYVYERHQQNVDLLREEGTLVTYYRLDSHGQSVPQVKTNLRLKVVSDCERQMVSILTALGMTPTAKDRARPTQPSVPADDEIIPGTMAYYAQQEKLGKTAAPFIVIPPADMEADNEGETN